MDKYCEAGTIRNFLRLGKNHKFQLQYGLKYLVGRVTEEKEMPKRMDRLTKQSGPTKTEVD
jgi:hypothetical protein